jgi:NitT/TauT family transport system permease protein
MTAFIISVPVGIIVGILCGISKNFLAFFSFFFAFISSSPVMALILIAYLIFGSETTPVVIGFLLIFPLLVSNVIEGITMLDPKKIELFKAYKISASGTLYYLILPSLKPYIFGGIRSGVALGWKVIIAAEVLVQPLFALGSGMQDAKAHLESAELFAWTFAAIIASVITNCIVGIPGARPGARPDGVMRKKIDKHR